MIHYCLITYLTCVNAKCVFKEHKNDSYATILSVSSHPYKSRKECLKENNYRNGTFGGVRQSITCYGRELKSQQTCLGETTSTTNYRTSVSMDLKK